MARPKIGKGKRPIDSLGIGKGKRPIEDYGIKPGQYSDMGKSHQNSQNANPPGGNNRARDGNSQGATKPFSDVQNKSVMQNNTDYADPNNHVDIPKAYQHRKYRVKYHRQQPVEKPIFDKVDGDDVREINAGQDSGHAWIVKRGSKTKGFQTGTDGRSDVSKINY